MDFLAQPLLLPRPCSSSLSPLLPPTFFCLPLSLSHWQWHCSVLSPLKIEVFACVCVRECLFVCVGERETGRQEGGADAHLNYISSCKLLVVPNES